MLENQGLCIAVYDFIILGNMLHASDGGAHIKVEFRLVMFRPSPGEIIIGQKNSNVVVLNHLKVLARRRNMFLGKLRQCDATVFQTNTLKLIKQPNPRNDKPSYVFPFQGVVHLRGVFRSHFPSRLQVIVNKTVIKEEEGEKG